MGPLHREIGSVISTDNAVGWGPQHREFRKEILQAMQVGGVQQREFLEKKFYKQCKLGKDTNLRYKA